LSDKAARKYLDRHAEREPRLADALGSFGHALVVPAYGEGDELVAMLRGVPRGARGEVLVVLVVNGKPSAPAWVHERNHAVVARLADAFGRGEPVSFDEPFARMFELGVGRLLLLDRFTEARRFPDGQGVGLARKIGVDLCARLHAAGRLASAFVQTTDADVELPADYFDRATDRSAAALLYPFSHRPEDDESLARAVLLYEISLRYYVLGLRFAASPYAYHTIGSTIAAEVGAYMKVRGFPRRDAAEDFYLLSKLAKVGPIVSLPGEPISIRGRASSRVPFGTGAAVTRIAAEGAHHFAMYEPAIFRYLRAWLSALGELDLATTERELEVAIDRRCRDEKLAAGPLVAALRSLGVHGAVLSAQASATSVQALRRRLAVWFDAFRTLKLVHVLERGGLSRVDFRDALRRAPFAAVGPLNDLPAIVARLAELERAPQ